MAGAGFRTFVDGDILTAAQVNTYLMEQSVMVFADAAARTSAIAAPSEGMVTYLADNNLIEYYDGAAWQPLLDQDVIAAKGDLIVGTGDDAVSSLAVGTNGQVLTADSSTATGLKWATGATADLVLVGFATPSNVASVSFDGIFTSTYVNYLLTWNTTTGDGSIDITFRASNADVTSTNYHNQELFVANTSVTAQRSNSQTKLRIGDSNTTGAGIAYIFDPQTSRKTRVLSENVFLNNDSPTDESLRKRAGLFGLTTQFDGVKVSVSSGNLNGNVAIYGLKA